MYIVWGVLLFWLGCLICVGLLETTKQSGKHCDGSLDGKSPAYIKARIELSDKYFRYRVEDELA